MCGRYNFIFNATMQSLFSELGVTASLANQFNITPTESVAIIIESQKHYECHLARWWLTPSWSNGPDQHYSMFNARAENLEHSRAFKGPFHHKRCIIPLHHLLNGKRRIMANSPMKYFDQNGSR